ncbi:MAG: methionine biosynthesis protein MetW [Actinomycetota bacterium]|nr:methionine biosynthesis protein MetW [Actinomycetota bacterium]MDQ6949376.1 methionine biosynthesis protein MetW [Actinomycetota bacterium]
MISESERWNHNIHYHRLILDSVPAGARDALDVGCGEGMLARRLRRGLIRMRELLRPGGTLAVVGLARRRLPAELQIELATILTNVVYRFTKSHWEHPSPTLWPPPETYASMRRLATRLLPGAGYGRHLLWRYSITWTKPTP